MDDTIIQTPMLPDKEIPLVVDLDGTLLNTDLLIESYLSLMLSFPLQAMAALCHTRAGIKSYIAERVALDWSSMPLNPDVLHFLQQEKAKGRKLYLASAADARYVKQIADHLGLFDGIFASDGIVNLAGKTKARKLCEAFGQGRFDYLGNALVDIPVWKAAHHAWVVSVPFFVLEIIRKYIPRIGVIGPPSKGIREYLQGLRVYQWVKNLLIFVPAFAAHELGHTLFPSLIAFFAFCLGASSCYLLNDLFDLRHDRIHPVKHARALASGRLNIQHAVILIPSLLAGAFILACFLPFSFSVVLLAYYITTCAYTLGLKRQVILDIILLACFYGIRLVAGGVATAVPLSPWLIGFSLFLFLCLALVKRCVELSDHKEKNLNDPAGRGYQSNDIYILQGMAIASGYVSVLVLALYINSSAVTILYRFPERLWLLCVFLIYWISRILLLVSRHKMHNDPVIFAMKDKVSLAILAASIITVIASA